MAKMVKVLMTLVAIAAIAQLAIATNYTVGAPSGSWNLQTNLTTWAESNTFHKGDVLIFSYSSTQHSVLEVTKSNYDSCTTSSPISTSTSGNTVVTLSADGTRYFICGFSGHCLGGMKVAINVVSSPSISPAPSSSVPSTPATPTSPSATPTSPSPDNSPPPPPSSAAISVSAGFGLGLGLAALLVL